MFLCSRARGSSTSRSTTTTSSSDLRRPRTPSTSPLPFVMRFAFHSPAHPCPTSPRAGPASPSSSRPPALPIPGAQIDPRQEALATVLDELTALGVTDDRQTILVAGGLARKLGQRDLERLLPPPEAREYRGRVLVHDAAAEDLVPVSLSDDTDARIHRALVETDLVVVVSAAETILHGGPGALLSASDATTVRRAAAASSLLQAAGEPAWELALAVERAVSSKVALTSVSLVLDHPRLTGRFRDYPHEPRLAPPRLELAVQAPVLASPGRCAPDHSPRSGEGDRSDRRLCRNALGRALRGAPPCGRASCSAARRAARRARRGRPLDRAARTPGAAESDHRPRRCRSGSRSGSGVTRSRSATAERSSSSIRSTRSFSHGPKDPYRRLLDALETEDVSAVSESERAAAADTRAVAAYRAGPNLPPAAPLRRLGRLRPGPVAPRSRHRRRQPRRRRRARPRIRARATRSRAPSRWPTASSGGRARVGVLLAPPYAPLLVGAGLALAEIGLARPARSS